MDINNTMDIIDSRDVIEKIGDLETDIELIKEDIQDYRDELANGEDHTEEEVQGIEDEIDNLTTQVAELEEELEPLKALAEECEGYGDWSYGATLIHEEYFLEYAEQLAEDIGAVSSNASWPNNHIDWDAAAEELKIDYMEVDFDGQTYLMRA